MDELYFFTSSHEREDKYWDRSSRYRPPSNPRPVHNQRLASIYFGQRVLSDPRVGNSPGNNDRRSFLRLHTDLLLLDGSLLRDFLFKVRRSRSGTRSGSGTLSGNVRSRTRPSPRLYRRALTLALALRHTIRGMKAAIDLHADLGPQEDGIVIPGDGALGLVGVVEGHSRKALAAACLGAHGHLALFDPGAVGALEEETLQIFLGGRGAEVLDEDRSPRGWPCHGAWAWPWGSAGHGEDG